MTARVAAGLAAAVAAAGFYGSAPVAQSVAASRTERGVGLGVRLTLRLARQPIWLLGLGCEAGGFLLEAYAFSAAPTALVAPVMACDMVVFVLLGRAVFADRPSPHAARGALAMGCGVTLLALAFSSDAALGSPATSLQLFGLLGACVAVAGLAALAGTRVLDDGRRAVAAALFSGAAGASYGLATLATRQVGRTWTPHHPLHLLATPTPYVLAGCSVLGITMMQRGLQTRPALAFPVTSAVSAFLPVLLGATLLSDRVPGGARSAAFGAALVLIGLGIALVGRERPALDDRS